MWELLVEVRHGRVVPCTSDLSGGNGVRQGDEKCDLEHNRSESIGSSPDAPAVLSPPPHTPRVSAVFSWERDLRKGGGFKTGSGKTPTKKGAGPGDAMPPPKHGAGGKGRGAWRRGMKVAGGGGGGGGRGGKGLFGDDDDDESGGGADGRPSIGTWNKTQDYLQILKEISGKVIL